MTLVFAGKFVGTQKCSAMPKLAFATDRQLRSAKPRATDYRIGCGGQLYLRITPTGCKYWQVRFYKPNGQENLHQFASYPQTSLLETKTRLSLILPELLAGRSPPAVIALRTERAALSFDDCAARFIEAKRHEWENAKHAQQWQNTLGQYASPIFGHQPIGSLTRDDVLRCLEPIWLTRNETASRLRGHIGVAPSLNELNHLLTKLRRVRRLGGMRFGHLGLLLGER